jgi:hypothetical protein
MIIRVIDFLLDAGSTLFWLLMYAAGATVIASKPDLLKEFALGMAQSPIIVNLWWLFAASMFLWLLRKFWTPVRLVAIRILNI